MNLKEKHIVEHLINNWSKYFGENYHFWKKEREWKPGWRPDITALKPIQMEHGIYKAPIFIEVKYNRNGQKNDRDLIYEVQKALDAIKRCKNPQYVIVISNDYSDKHIVEFMVKNKVPMYKFDFSKPDLSDFRLYKYDPDKNGTLTLKR